MVIFLRVPSSCPLPRFLFGHDNFEGAREDFHLNLIFCVQNLSMILYAEVFPAEENFFDLIMPLHPLQDSKVNQREK